MIRLYSPRLNTMRIRFIFCIIFLCSCNSMYAQIPVILRATSNEQSDSTGCNFVKEVCRITYEAIIAGKAKLWDSQSKDIQIFPSGLVDIEKSSNTSFIDQEVIFIYEYWTNSNRDLKSTTTGLLFSNKTKTGEEVAYGYVDFNDLQESFMRARLQTNANGNYNTTLAYYIYNKNYNYKILQFAGKVIDNVSSSQLIKDNFIGTNRFNISAFSTNEIPQKMVTWILDSNNDLVASKTEAGIELIHVIDSFFRSNEEIFLNLGGDRIITQSKAKSWNISKIEVHELWKKIDNKVLFDPISVIVFINDSAMTEIQYRDLLKMDIKIGEKTWVDILREKPFQYYITQINSQKILRREGFQYQKGLLTYDWNKITEFVKYY